MGVSVGNAAWPIGVTQVGLHERSAREKIRLGAGTTVVSALDAWLDGAGAGAWSEKIRLGAGTTVVSALSA